MGEYRKETQKLNYCCMQKQMNETPFFYKKEIVMELYFQKCSVLEHKPISSQFQSRF